MGAAVRQQSISTATILPATSMSSRGCILPTSLPGCFSGRLPVGGAKTHERTGKCLGLLLGPGETAKTTLAHLVLAFPGRIVDLPGLVLLY